MAADQQQFYDALTASRKAGVPFETFIGQRAKRDTVDSLVRLFEMLGVRSQPVLDTEQLDFRAIAAEAKKLQSAAAVADDFQRNPGGG